MSTAALTAAITAGLSAVIHFAVYKCVYKLKAKVQEETLAGINPSEKSDMDDADDYESVQEYNQ